MSPSDLEREANDCIEHGDLEEAERLRDVARRMREADEDAALTVATKGEHFNYAHYGRVAAERLRLKERP